ncbi:MAG: hypothetical protein JSR53_12785, partial [Proteobacteria bacterium]|nr:hypothetical protein [Pseudomonadota bacterium]
MAGAIIACNCSITPGSHEHASLRIRDRHVEHLLEHRPPQVRQPPRAIRLFGLHAPSTWRTAALRITLDQRDKAVIGQLLMLGTQASARLRTALHARAQAAIQQDA